MSGSLFAPWSRVRDPMEYAVQLASKFNCSTEAFFSKKSANQEDDEFVSFPSNDDNNNNKNDNNDNTNKNKKNGMGQQQQWSAKEEEERLINCLRTIPAEKLLRVTLRVPSFHLDFGPSFDGVTIKDNFADIKGKRSFGTRQD